MPSIFDTLLGLNPTTPAVAAPAPSMLQPFGYQSNNADTLLGLSQGLLSAGAPSPYPQDFGTALGKGIQGANAAQETGEDKYLKRALTGAQVQKANADIANEKAWQDLFKAPAAAANSGMVAPATASPTIPPAATLGGGIASLPASWDPHYQAASANTGLSIDLLKAKDAAESGGNANAVSSAGAAGPAQLMPGTARDLGVTNPKDPAQAIPGGATYLKQQYDKYKNFDHALMAYNWGPGNVDKWLAAGGDPSQLPAETQGYIAKVKANLPQQATFGTLPNAAPGQAITQPAGGLPVASGTQVAQGAAPATQTLPQVIQALPPAVRQMMGAMPRKDALPLLLKYADPETHVAIDTQTGQVVFAPKTDKSGRFQPIDVMKLDIEKQNAESQRRQAAAREFNAKGENANRAITLDATGNAVPNEQLPAAKGAVIAAEEKARQEASLDADAAKGLVAGAVKEFTEKERPKALAIQEQIPQLHNIRRAIDAGAITGTGTTARNTLAQLASTLGFQSNEAAITPTYIAGMAQQILANAKALGSNPSNTEDKIIGAATGANPDTSKEGVLRLLDVNESLLRKANDRYNAEAGRIKTLRGVSAAYPNSYFDLPQPPTYEEWSKSNAIASPSAGTPAAVPLPPSGYRTPGVQNGGGIPAPPSGFKVIQ